jgi:hypothetical protein
MNDEPLSPEVFSVLRDQAFEEIERVAGLAASYSRSLAEAAFRSDQVTMTVHLRQLRDCTRAMIDLQKDFLQRSSPSSKTDTRGTP